MECRNVEYIMFLRPFPDIRVLHGTCPSMDNASAKLTPEADVDAQERCNFHHSHFLTIIDALFPPNAKAFDMTYSTFFSAKNLIT